jgi:hypothetical protein
MNKDVKGYTYMENKGLGDTSNNEYLSNIHCGFAKTKEDAYRKIQAYHLKTYNNDISYEEIDKKYKIIKLDTKGS